MEWTGLDSPTALISGSERLYDSIARCGQERACESAVTLTTPGKVNMEPDGMGL